MTFLASGSMSAVRSCRSILSVVRSCRSILAVTVVAGALYDLTVVASDDLHGVGAAAPVFLSGLLFYRIGEKGAGLRTMACMVASSGVDLPRKACHSGSCAILARAAPRSFRSR